MGHVYRARDTKLGRDVAIKVLPELFASDPERLGRFQREAQVLASLNHPNIAQIFGIEETPGGRALVMEFVEGQTLAESIGSGVHPADALAIARQIAEALEAAHDLGIIHRDLKPANVKVRPDGTVKVLDFGLAKALDPLASSGNPMTSPTISIHATQAGVILGTAAYMAPEQARGKPVDRRADIWAFGAVLYELLAGATLFPGDTVSDTLAGVLTRDPDWSKLPAGTPSAIRQLLRRCLERDPRRRLQAIGEARIALSDPETAVEPAPIDPRRSGWRIGLVALVALGAAATGFLLRGAFGQGAPPPDAVRKLDLAVPDFHLDFESPPALSPNGQWMVHSVGGRLMIRSMSDFSARPLGGGAAGHYPFWSPDSREVAFVRDRKLWRSALDGNEASPVTAVPNDLSGSGGGAWTAGGQLVLAGSNSVGLFAVGANGTGAGELLALSRPDESDFHELSALPGDRGLIFTVHSGGATDRIDAFAGGKRKTLLQLRGENLSWPVYAAPGYLLFARETTSPGIWGIRFSMDRLETQGDPFPVAPGGMVPSVGADGTLAIVRPSDLPSELVSIDRHGSLKRIGMLQGQYWDPRIYRGVSLSPDGRRLALTMAESGGSEIWSYELARGTMTRLSLGGQVVVNPTWSIDGTRVLFGGFAGHRAWNVLAVPSSEPAKPQRSMPISNDTEFPCTISPDGKWLIYLRATGADLDIWLAPLNGTAGQPLMKTPALEADAAFSPDGRWIAYTSNDTGRNEIYVRAFPLDAQRTQVSKGGGTFPAWSPDGQEVFYRSSAGLAAVRLKKNGSGLDTSEPSELFPLTADSRLFDSYAVAPDGARFFFLRSTGDDRLSVIENWTGLLKGEAK
jgi:serine/threonine protein kinase/WD40 repeat protein